MVFEFIRIRKGREGTVLILIIGILEYLSIKEFAGFQFRDESVFLVGSASFQNGIGVSLLCWLYSFLFVNLVGLGLS
jgi:hypothetical protein